MRFVFRMRPDSCTVTSSPKTCSSGVFHRSHGPEIYANLPTSDQRDRSVRHIRYISTRWYRPPETLLTDGMYDFQMDVFGMGCVLFELIALYPLFPGKDELDQINRIHAIIGTPGAEVLQRIRKGTKNNPIKGEFAPMQGAGVKRLLPNSSDATVDLIMKMLIYDPLKRISAEDCLAHPYFDDFDRVLTVVRREGICDEEYVSYLEDCYKQYHLSASKKVQLAPAVEPSSPQAKVVKKKHKPMDGSGDILRVPVIAKPGNVTHVVFGSTSVPQGSAGLPQLNVKAMTGKMYKVGVPKK